MINCYICCITYFLDLFIFPVHTKLFLIRNVERTCIKKRFTYCMWHHWNKKSLKRCCRWNRWTPKAFYCMMQSFRSEYSSLKCINSNIYGQVIKCVKAQFSVTHLSSVTFKRQGRLECDGAYNKKWREAEDTHTYTHCPKERELKLWEGHSGTVIQCIYWCLKMKVEKCRRGLILFLT